MAKIILSTAIRIDACPYLLHLFTGCLPIVYRLITVEQPVNNRWTVGVDTERLRPEVDEAAREGNKKNIRYTCIYNCSRGRGWCSECHCYSYRKRRKIRFVTASPIARKSRQERLTIILYSFISDKISRNSCKTEYYDTNEWRFCNCTSW